MFPSFLSETFARSRTAAAGSRSIFVRVTVFVPRQTFRETDLRRTSDTANTMIARRGARVYPCRENFRLGRNYKRREPVSGGRRLLWPRAVNRDKRSRDVLRFGLVNGGPSREKNNEHRSFFDSSSSSSSSHICGARVPRRGPRVNNALPEACLTAPDPLRSATFDHVYITRQMVLSVSVTRS